DLARRRGEDVAKRDELFDHPDVAIKSIRRLGTIAVADSDDHAASAPDVVFPIRPPEAVDRDIKQLRRLVRDGTPTIILCDNEGQAERLDELLSDDDRGSSRGPGGSPAALSIGVLHGGFIVPGLR